MGPKPLADILDRAIAKRATRSAIILPPRTVRRAGAEHGSVHPALCAALTTVARSALQERDDDRRSLAALRAAVTDYARELKAADVPVERVVNLVHDAVADCASVVGAEAAIPVLLLESEEWARSAYHAACGQSVS